HYQPKATTHQARPIPLVRYEKHTVVSQFHLRSDGELAEDIQTKSGTVLLPAGFTLNQLKVLRMWALAGAWKKISLQGLAGFSTG
ncbi:MAG: hypothetical protein P8N63_05430, partial [Pseudomonadales bacterium]|nr:hypothetical protein [Pseudomonadales bacterium]